MNKAPSFIDFLDMCPGNVKTMKDSTKDVHGSDMSVNYHVPVSSLAGCPSSSAAGVDGLSVDVCFLPSGNKFIDLLWVACEVVPSVGICYIVAWI